MEFTQYSPFVNFLPDDWTEEKLLEFLAARDCEDIHLEFKAFLHYDWDLINLAQKVGKPGLEKNPFHDKKPSGSFQAYRAIETIIGFANTRGGLLLIGVMEERDGRDTFPFDGVRIKKPREDGFFLLVGVERDGIGLKGGSIKEDSYKLELLDILFPHGKDQKTYTKQVEGKNKDNKPDITKKKFTVDFPESYNKSLLKAFKLYRLSSTVGKLHTIAALVIGLSADLIVVDQRKEGESDAVSVTYGRTCAGNDRKTGKEINTFRKDLKRSHKSRRAAEKDIANLLTKMGQLQQLSSTSPPLPENSHEDISSVVLTETDSLPPPVLAIDAKWSDDGSECGLIVNEMYCKAKEIRKWLKEKFGCRESNSWSVSKKQYIEVIIPGIEDVCAGKGYCPPIPNNN